MTLDKNRKSHVILYGIAKRTLQKKNLGWLATIVNVKELKSEGPISVYYEQTVLGQLNWLEEKGYVEKVNIYGKKVGYSLTEKGIDFIEENGKPKQYH